MKTYKTTLWASLVAGAVGLILSGLAHAEGKLVFIAGGGSYYEGFQKAHLRSFEEATGIDVEE